MAGAAANVMQQQNGGRPGEASAEVPMTDESIMRSDAQPAK
ncbi:MAG: hypothetical protein WC219_07905 [Acholeplasmataceae bacterium]